MENKIVMIPTEKLHPHVDNPRRDLGDLSELTESIGRNGIRQNLTVVPATGYYDGDYTVIIGHRRLAAAKAAGLTELPCAVAELSPAEQISAMLEENMQRSDLTVCEQAQGIQMAIDLGETVETIAEKTGFSESTVRRRLKIAKLDRETLENAEKKAQEEGRQITFAEIEKLDAIKDAETRNRVLKSIGTISFDGEVRNAVYKEQEAERKAGISDELEKAGAAPVEDTKGLQYCGYLSRPCDVWTEAEKLPEDTELRYRKEPWGGIAVYRTKTDEEKAEDLRADEKKRQYTAEQQEIKAAKERLNAIGGKIFTFRADFVRDFAKRLNFTPQQTAAIADFEVWLHSPDEIWDIHANPEFDDELFREITEMRFDEDTLPEEVTAFVKEHYTAEAGRFILDYCVSGDGRRIHCYDGWGCWQENERLERIYDLLMKLGYSMSNEETEFLTGTHEAYREKSE